MDLKHPKSDIRAHKGQVSVALTTKTANRAFTASEDGVLNEWDTQSRLVTQEWSLEESIIALAASADGDVIVASCSEYSIIFNSSYYSDLVQVFRSGVKGANDSW